jgi:hypothetical protein
MLNTMSEKKKKKLVEFKIVKSSENETPRDSKSASPNIKITKNSPDKKKTKKSNVALCEPEKIKILKIGVFESSPTPSKSEVKLKF